MLAIVLMLPYEYMYCTWHVCLCVSIERSSSRRSSARTWTQCSRIARVTSRLSDARRPTRSSSAPPKGWVHLLPLQILYTYEYFRMYSTVLFTCSVCTGWTRLACDSVASRGRPPKWGSQEMMSYILNRLNKFLLSFNFMCCP